jgi:hypothetical protein
MGVFLFGAMANYCTAAEVKSAANKAGSEWDTLLTDTVIPAVSEAIDNFCNRPDGFVAGASASVRTYSGSGDTVQWIDECVSVTQVAVKDSPTDDDYDIWATTTWQAATGDPIAPDFNRTPYRFLIVTATDDYEFFTSGQFTTRRGFRPRAARRRGTPTVQVTARWGYAETTPPSVNMAAIVQATRIVKRGEGAFADALATGEFGKLVFARDLDPIVRNMLIKGRLVMPAMGRRY